VLVQQIKSRIGERPATRRTLRALGFSIDSRPGQARVVRVTARAPAQIAAVRHLVAVDPLTESTVLGTPDREPEVRMRTLPYEIDGREARRYEVDQNSYLDVQLFEGFFSLTWSTALAFRDVWRELRSLLPEPAGCALVYDPQKEGHWELKLPTVIRRLSSGDAAYPFVRAEFAGVTLVWQRPLYPRHVDEDLDPGKLGIISESFDSEYYGEMVRRTATRSLGRIAAELLEDAAYVGAHVRQGRPGPAE
jgi:ribosomal protein L30/L7E